MRRGCTIGANTDEASLADQVQRYKPRTFHKVKNETTKGDSPAMDHLYCTSVHEPLSEKCKRIVVANFATFPVHENIPAKHIREITQNLPVDLDANIAAEFVFDENYWKRRCIEHFLQRNCQISEHGLTWKQLYFENYLQKSLEEYEPETKDDSLPALLRTVKTCQDYIFTLSTRQLLAHPDMEQICQAVCLKYILMPLGSSSSFPI